MNEKNLCFQMRTGILLIPLNISQEKRALPHLQLKQSLWGFFYTHDNKSQICSCLDEINFSPEVSIFRLSTNGTRVNGLDADVYISYDCIS